MAEAEKLKKSNVSDKIWMHALSSMQANNYIISNLIC